MLWEGAQQRTEFGGFVAEHVPRTASAPHKSALRVADPALVRSGVSIPLLQQPSLVGVVFAKNHEIEGAAELLLKNITVNVCASEVQEGAYHGRPSRCQALLPLSPERC